VEGLKNKKKEIIIFSWLLLTMNFPYYTIQLFEIRKWGVFMTEHEHEESESIITLTDEDGQEFDFELIDMLKVEGSDYAILLPLEEDEESDEAIILRVLYDEQGEIETLENIEDDEEWEKVADAWQETLENEDAE